MSESLAPALAKMDDTKFWLTAEGASSSSPSSSPRASLALELTCQARVLLPRRRRRRLRHRRQSCGAVGLSHARGTRCLLGTKYTGFWQRTGDRCSHAEWLGEGTEWDASTKRTEQTKQRSVRASGAPLAELTPHPVAAALCMPLHSHHSGERFMQSISEESRENGAAAPPPYFFEVMPLITAVTRPLGMEQ